MDAAWDACEELVNCRDDGFDDDPFADYDMDGNLLPARTGSCSVNNKYTGDIAAAVEGVPPFLQPPRAG